MSRYMIRKPEFLNGAEQARFFPGVFMTFVIAIAVFASYFALSIVAGLIYGAASVRMIMSGDIDAKAYIQGVLIFALFFEVALIACVLIYTRYIERRALSTLGLGKRMFAFKYAAGFVAGMLLLAVNFIPAFISVPFTYKGFQPIAIVFLAAFMVQSAAEEVLFRGYIMTSLMRRSSAFLAVIISTAAFALIHIPLSNITIMQFCGVTVLGAVLALYMLRTNNLWGAMGLHAAWNFFTCILVPMKLGQFEIGYAIFSVPAVDTESPLMVLLQFAILLAAVALLLFAGKNRLVVRKTRQEIVHGLAVETAKDYISGREMRSYALRVSELAIGGEGKIAALLYHAMGCGASAEYVRQTFGDELFFAADAMLSRPGEGPQEYLERVSKYPAAIAVKAAEARLEEIRRAKEAGREAQQETVQCPLLERAIEADYCSHVASVADGEAPAWGEDYIRALDRNICVNCPRRNLAKGDPASEFLARYRDYSL